MSVSWSSIQYCMRSLPETSTRLPAEANTEMPRPRRAAEASTATPSAPLWAKRPSRPDPGMTEASVALSRTAGSLLMRPKLFGPTTRIPARRTRRRSFSCRRTPSSPASAKPAERTSSALTPALPQSLTTSMACAAGTTTMARSTGSGTSWMLG